MGPDLGVLLSAEYSMAELGELGQLSEQLGYRYFWYVDTRFRPECYLGLAQVAAKTERILLGTGVTDPFSRHPAITAVSIATLDEMSGGRAILGLGAGGATLRQLGIDWKLPVAALESRLTSCAACCAARRSTSRAR
jgi:5,10-methylenetetrahydromethanopterin reductase